MDRLTPPTATALVSAVPSYNPIPDYSNLSDQQIIDNPPPPTGYNSTEGYRIINKVIYYDGDLGPDGRKVVAPILTDEEWAAAFETFPHIRYGINPRNHHKIKISEQKPAKLNSVDKEIMTAFNENDRVLVLAFRDARKSTNLQRYIKRRVLDFGETCAYFCETAKMAKKLTEKIKQQFTKNAAILRAYGYIVDDDQTSKKDLMYWKSQGEGASFEIGLTVGSSEGTSLMGGHPVNLALDDVVGESVKGHPVQLAQIQDWFIRQVDPMATEFSKLLVVGTIKDPDDLYNYLQNTGLELETVIIPGIREWPNNGQRTPGTAAGKNQWYYVFHQTKNKQSFIKGVGGLLGGKTGFDEYFMALWTTPGRVQYWINDDEKLGVDKNRMAMQEFLLRLRALGPEGFESEYQMHAMAVGSGCLKLDLMDTFDWEDVDQTAIEQNCFAFLDHHLGDSSRSHPNFLVVCAAVMEADKLDFYIIDCFMWKNDERGVFGKIEKLKEVKELYPFIQDIGIEAGMSNTADQKMIDLMLPGWCTPKYQNNLKSTSDEDDDELKTRKLVLDFLEKIPASDKGKVVRIINQWCTRLSQKCVHIREGLDPEILDIIAASKSFPRCKIMEFLDAGGSVMDMAAEGGCNNVIFLHG